MRCSLTGTEILARVAESGLQLRSAPARVCLPDYPTPTAPILARHYYPRAHDVADAVRLQLGLPAATEEVLTDSDFLDIPDPTFTGPF